MAFTEAERVQIRRYLCFPALFQMAEPRLENAITSIQAKTDGGTRPDNSTELAVRGYLAKLASIETQWLSYLEYMAANQADTIHIDPLRGLQGLFKIGRIYVRNIADALNTEPLDDMFTMAGTNPQGGPNRIGWRLG